MVRLDANSHVPFLTSIALCVLSSLLLTRPHPKQLERDTSVCLYSRSGLSRQVCLIHDPRPDNPTGAAYAVDCLGNMVGGRPTVYNNQPVELLARLAAEAIREGRPVWFGCEVGKHFASKLGIIDTTM